MSRISNWFKVEIKSLYYLSMVYSTDKGLAFYQREKHGLLRLYLPGKQPIPTNNTLEIWR